LSVILAQRFEIHADFIGDFFLKLGSFCKNAFFQTEDIPTTGEMFDATRRRSR
jgi:hypothetical protein